LTSGLNTDHRNYRKQFLLLFLQLLPQLHRLLFQPNLRLYQSHLKPLKRLLP